MIRTTFLNWTFGGGAFVAAVVCSFTGPAYLAALFGFVSAMNLFTAAWSDST